MFFIEKIKIPKSRLFHQIADEELAAMLKCLGAVSKRYSKGEYMFHMGETISSVGLVAEGSVHVMKEDYWGNRHLLNTVEPGQLFGESYACLKGQPLMVSVAAAEPALVLYLDIKRVLTLCSSACTFHTRLIHNLLGIQAEKNLMLTQKIEHMSKRSIREKMLSYLSYQARAACSDTFLIPFNRQELAEYLGVDRSALSAELSRMQKEGILRYHRNKFTLES